MYTRACSQHLGQLGLPTPALKRHKNQTFSCSVSLAFFLMTGENIAVLWEPSDDIVKAGKTNDYRLNQSRTAESKC